MIEDTCSEKTRLFHRFAEQIYSIQKHSSKMKKIFHKKTIIQYTFQESLYIVF